MMNSTHMTRVPNSVLLSHQIPMLEPHPPPLVLTTLATITVTDQRTLVPPPSTDPETVPPSYPDLDSAVDP